MKVIKLLVITVLTIVSCKSQIKSSSDNIKNKTMENLDINKFNQKKEINGYRFLTTDSSLVRQFVGKISDDVSVIVEEKTPLNSNYNDIKEYFGDDGKIKLVGKKFYNFPIEIWKEYNKDGVLVKETNYEDKYIYSIEDLSSKMLQNYGVNIFEKKPGLIVSRNIYEPFVYNVRYPIIEGYVRSWNVVIIDGKTGEVISESMGKNEK